MADQTPRVSVLMPVFQPDEHYLAEQLDTIDAQEYDSFEIVVYDDCPDGPSWEELCRAHCKRHPLRYLRGEQNLGYVKAFEHLVGEAQGVYLAFADQDDRWLPGRLALGAQKLDAGYVLVSCDRQVIDGADSVQAPSWRAAHPNDESLTWESGEDITARAAFTCYSIGMATMIRADVARKLMPYPTCTGHDKWLALGASAVGPCANIEMPLVQYRRHGSNQTGVLAGISSKDDWYRRRTQDAAQLVREFAQRFPDHPALPEMEAFARARLSRDRMAIWHHRSLAPDVARFELALSLTPEWAFQRALGLLRQGR